MQWGKRLNAVKKAIEGRLNPKDKHGVSENAMEEIKRKGGEEGFDEGIGVARARRKKEERRREKIGWGKIGAGECGVGSELKRK
jgi:hypothetical protein